MKVEFVNLLPVGYRRRQLVQLRIKQWICLWSVGMSLMGLYTWFRYQSFANSRQTVSSREMQYKPIKQLELETTKLATEIDDLKKREQLALTIDNDRPLIQLVGIVSHVAGTAGGVVVQKFEIDSAQVAEDPQRRKLKMQGLGVSGEAITEFLRQLRDSKMFVQVDLSSTEESKQNKDLRTYSIEGAF